MLPFSQLLRMRRSQGIMRLFQCQASSSLTLSSHEHNMKLPTSCGRSCMQLPSKVGRGMHGMINSPESHCGAAGRSQEARNGPTNTDACTQLHTLAGATCRGGGLCPEATWHHLGKHHAHRGRQDNRSAVYGTSCHGRASQGVPQVLKPCRVSSEVP